MLTLLELLHQLRHRLDGKRRWSRIWSANILIWPQVIFGNPLKISKFSHVTKQYIMCLSEFQILNSCYAWSHNDASIETIFPNEWWFIIECASAVIVVWKRWQMNSTTYACSEWICDIWSVFQVFRAGRYKNLVNCRMMTTTTLDQLFSQYHRAISLLL